MIFGRKYKKNELTNSERSELLIILNKILEILKLSNVEFQTYTLENLIQLLYQKDDQQFIKGINGIEMWGGSGAVWEIYIEDEIYYRKFQIEIINLINLMEDINILGKGVKPIRKLFQNDIS